MTPAYQLNALFQIVRTMKRTEEGREALEEMKGQLQEGHHCPERKTHEREITR